MADIEEISENIARHNPRAAIKFSSLLLQKFEALARNPSIGRARPELPRPNLRSSPVGTYILLYREIEIGAEIVRVVHGARNLEDLI